MAHWFAYNGTGNPNLPGSYYRMFNKPLCMNGSKICAILLDDNSSGSPSSVDDVAFYIDQALAFRISQPMSPSGAVKFVYLRCDC